MADLATDIKSMKLYSHIERVDNELAELGKSDDASLTVAELREYDQLHYHGTDAVDSAIQMTGIDSYTRVLEIGSGLGGPARHIAFTTGAQISALELQANQDQIASALTERCGLSTNLTHLCGDVLTYDWQQQQFDVIVSWLAMYHIPDRDRLLALCRDLLPSGGIFYTEDLFSRQLFSEQERSELASELYANHLPDFTTYQAEFERAGFILERVEDMSDDWTNFTSERLTDYRACRERHIRVHGEPTYLAMQAFYELVNRYFYSGKLGGIRLLARNP